jgi:hypothetical protein
MKRKKILHRFAAAAIAAVVSFATVAEPLQVFAGEQLGETDFEEGKGLPWHIVESGPGKMEFDITGGKYVITIVNPGGASRGGEDRWDCQFRHRGLEDVYYLKQTEDGVSMETAARLLTKAGYTPLDCLNDSARIGDLGGTLTDRIHAVRGGLVEDGVTGIALSLSRSEELFRMMDRSYRMGLTDIPASGEFDPGRKLSAGEGIARAYRLAAALTACSTVVG